MPETLKPGEEYEEWKAQGNNETQKTPEEESSEIDFEWYERSLQDGTADEYMENVGALPAEALLEEQDDERVWSETRRKWP